MTGPRFPRGRLPLAVAGIVAPALAPDAASVRVPAPADSQAQPPLVTVAAPQQDETKFLPFLRFVLEQEGKPGQAPGEALTQGMGLSDAAYEEYQRTHPQEYAAAMSAAGQQAMSPSALANFHRAIWRSIWDQSGAEKLPPSLGLVHADAAVQHGPGVAKEMLVASGGDPEQYLALREAHYQSIPDTAIEGGAAQNPGWLQKRMPALRAAIASQPLRGVARLAQRHSVEE
jgi:hypothetical protein